MSTGIESWNQNLLDIGPMYPFPGSEYVLAIAGLASWVIWHIIQIRNEAKVFKEEDQHFSDKERLESAMNVSNAETLIESMEAHASQMKN